MTDSPRGAPGTPRLLAVAVATVLGVGFCPVAPGTAGTLAAVPLAWALGCASPWAGALAAVALFAAGWAAAGTCEGIFGRRDPPPVVIDEVVGLLIAVAGLAPRWPVLAAGFISFRLTDILKPWPAGAVDRRVPGGLGVMLDDVVAGLYARALLEVVLRILPPTLLA